MARTGFRDTVFRTRMPARGSLALSLAAVVRIGGDFAPFDNALQRSYLIGS
jgi:hypothetical protein